MFDAGHLDHLRNVFYWRSPGPGPNRGWTWLAGTEGVEIIVRGRSWLELHGGRHELGIGSMVWHQPGDRTLCEVDPDDPYHTVAIRFATTRPTTTRAPRLVAWQDPGEAQAFGDEILGVFNLGGFDRHWFMHYIYSRLWWQVHRAEIAGAHRLMPAALQSAMRFIEDRFRGAVAVADIARAAGFSPSTLHALFRRHLGITPLEALTRRRLQHAREQLVHAPDEAVRAIARQSGFADAVHFGRVFRQRHGCPPGEYRRRHADAALPQRG